MSLLPTKNHFLSSPWIPREKFKSPVDANCYFCTSTSVMYLCEEEECHVFACEKCCILPCEARCHWLHHPHHPLCINILHEAEKGLCDGCHYLLWCHVYYKCEQCVFRLCVECFLSSRTNRRPLRWENDHKRRHPSHIHEFTRCRFREDIKDCKCVICEGTMWGVGYACLKCNHFIHKSCLDMAQIIIEHPLHPFHSLTFKGIFFPIRYVPACRCCNIDFKEQDYPIGCEQCEFYLHWRCAEVRAVNLDCHEHSLCFLSRAHNMDCLRCGKYIGDEPFARCMECPGRKGFHLKCVDIPPKCKHTAHHHTLALRETREIVYRSEEYYCDICEATRDPLLPSYCCQECNFFAHIECALSKEEEESVGALLTSTNSKTDEKPPDPTNSSNKQILHLIHPHPLSFHQNVTGTVCKMCFLKFNGGGAYKCQYSCNWFWVHERCATLPEELEHSLHPNHKLSLFITSLALGLRICYLCRELIHIFSYACRTCNFVIDIKCVFREECDELCTQSLLKFPFHPHELSLGIDTSTYQFICRFCDKNCIGSLAYYCLQSDCRAAFHKACLEWPRVIESHPLHPSHGLKLTGLLERNRISSECLACGLKIDDQCGWYECEMYPLCGVAFHTQCGSSLGRFLKHKHHDHPLYFYNKAPKFKWLWCFLCGLRVEQSLYGCIECKRYFHLRCLRLPCTAKHKRHLHPLTFMDCTDRGGYYCDVCEEARDFEHPVYCCANCDFVTHVECIASEENASNLTPEEKRLKTKDEYE